MTTAVEIKFRCKGWTSKAVLVRSGPGIARQDDDKPWLVYFERAGGVTESEGDERAFGGAFGSIIDAAQWLAAAGWEEIP